jgi:23S rRNA (uracil1939-C5)-methyltransferase
MKQRSNNRGPSTRRPSSSPQGARPTAGHKSNPRAPLNKSPKHSSATPPNVGSTKIMRKAGFSGKLHRGHVVDAATDFATTCAVKAQCGSCVFVNTNYGESLLKKFQVGIETLKTTGVLAHAQILDPMPSPTPLGYRSYFKLAVRPANSKQKAEAERDGQSRRFAIGLFVPGTHQVSVDMTDCPIHTKPLTSLLKSLQAEIESSTLEPWDETSGNGDLRYVAARASHLTGEIMITFVVTKPHKQELIKFVNRLRRMGHKINSAHMNINTAKGNAIFGHETSILAGTTALRERVCDLDIEISPTAFFQVNPWQAGNLYRRVEMHAGRGQPGDVAWDLYTGTGQMALILARSGYRTLGIEEVSAATIDATRNAHRNRLDERASFIAARVEDSETLLPEWSRHPRVIVVNPSRRGLHENARMHLTHILRSNEALKFIYVSCDAETLARDLKDLTASGYKVRQIEAFDMFAQTDKLEWIAVLTK